MHGGQVLRLAGENPIVPMKLRDALVGCIKTPHLGGVTSTSRKVELSLYHSVG